jgi:hypothetical protein
MVRPPLYYYYYGSSTHLNHLGPYVTGRSQKKVLSTFVRSLKFEKLFTFRVRNSFLTGPLKSSKSPQMLFLTLHQKTLVCKLRPSFLRAAAAAVHKINALINAIKFLQPLLNLAN